MHWLFIIMEFYGVKCSLKSEGKVGCGVAVLIVVIISDDSTPPGDDSGDTCMGPKVTRDRQLHVSVCRSGECGDSSVEDLVTCPRDP